MTEEQKERKKAYMKQYVKEHKKEASENRKKWYNNHKEQQLEANKKIYQRLKENNNTWQQRNKDKVAINQKKYRDKKIAELKAKGITNPYMVFLKKGDPKYENS